MLINQFSGIKVSSSDVNHIAQIKPLIAKFKHMLKNTLMHRI